MADVPLNMPGILVGIAGGSGSGKSVVASTLLEELGYDQSAIVQQDAYYRELSHLSPSDREKRNFDHPDAIDVPLLTAQVQALMAGGISPDKVEKELPFLGALLKKTQDYERITRAHEQGSQPRRPGARSGSYYRPMY